MENRKQAKLGISMSEGKASWNIILS